MTIRFSLQVKILSQREIVREPLRKILIVGWYGIGMNTGMPRNHLLKLEHALGRATSTEVCGRINSVSGLSIGVAGFGSLLAIGDRFCLSSGNERVVLGEVLGFKGGVAQAMAFGPLNGLGPCSNAWMHLNPGTARSSSAATLAPCSGWLGRVIDPLGNPLDGLGTIPLGNRPREVHAGPPTATIRGRLGDRLDLGVSALNLFTSCRSGQRLGLFAGSGVGKSTLLAMLARNGVCDVAVLALVGERGREVREFLEDDLGPAGLARSVVVAATSDLSPLVRREAAYAAMTVAEHFRDEGKSVLLLMDSVTRFCFALREIGLSVGEPPAARGYPPSVFAELPRLLERAGPGCIQHGKSGQITALFTVLVDGDDHNEPIADAIRGILDGHVVLDRQVAEAGRYPAVNILRSLSRTAPGCLQPRERELVARARTLLALYAEVADLVRLGAYKPGSDPAVDEAVKLAPRIERSVSQTHAEHYSVDESFNALAAAMEAKDA